MNSHPQPDRDGGTKRRVQLVSDLHLELLGRFPGWHGIPANPLADLLVLAGDVGSVGDVVRLFGNWPVPVIWVAGNHEFYGAELSQAREQARRLVQKTSILFLDNDEVGVSEWSRFEAWFAPRAARLRELRILGATLWTDYKYFDGDPRHSTVTERMLDVNRRLNDHRLIRRGDRAFSTMDALAEHRQSRQWLESAMAAPFAGKTLVVTHHGPHRGSVHPRYAGEALNCAFVSEIPELLRQADLWVHGHVHDSFRYRVFGCDVVVNPRGYPRNQGSVDDPNALVFENKQFDAALLVEL